MQMAGEPRSSWLSSNRSLPICCEWMPPFAATPGSAADLPADTRVSFFWQEAAVDGAQPFQQLGCCCCWWPAQLPITSSPVVDFARQALRSSGPRTRSIRSVGRSALAARHQIRAVTPAGLCRMILFTAHCRFFSFDTSATQSVGKPCSAVGSLRSPKESVKQFYANGLGC